MTKPKKETVAGRHVAMPDSMWADLEAYARRLAYENNERVSVSEALRRIVEQHLKEERGK